MLPGHWSAPGVHPLMYLEIRTGAKIAMIASDLGTQLQNVAVPGQFRFLLGSQARRAHASV